MREDRFFTFERVGLTPDDLGVAEREVVFHSREEEARERYRMMVVARRSCFYEMGWGKAPVQSNQPVWEKAVVKESRWGFCG